MSTAAPVAAPVTAPRVPSGSRRPQVALAHDWLVGLRGGERVLDRFARLFGPAPIYTLVDDSRPLSEAIAACRVVTSPLQRFPGATGAMRRWYLPLMPWAVAHLHVEPCDLLISTSSAVIKAIAAPPGTPHLCYCHSPARWMWGQAGDYRRGSGGLMRAAGLGLIGGPFRRWDRAAAAGVTRFLANSRHTAERIRSAWGREATVVYPPVRTEFFRPAAGDGAPSGREREPWLLVVAALEPYKRTDLAIRAANAARLPLKVVGDGSQRRVLESLAGPTVEMLGRVSDDALLDLFQRARALVHPQVEDFGITAVEAQAAGCPVVARDAGGARETVTRETGVLFTEPTEQALLDAIDALDRVRPSEAACSANAKRFGEARFDAEIERHVNELLDSARQA